MKTPIGKFFTFILLIFAFSFSMAENPHAPEAATHVDEKAQRRTEIQADIEHHLQDSHFYGIFGDKEKGVYYGFPLPVILIDNGLKVFSSSEFDHGKKLVEKDGIFYKLYHNKIYKTDAQGTINYDEHHHAMNEKPLDFSITKNVFNIILTGVILLLLFGAMAKGYRKSMVPKGVSSFLEPIVLYVKDEIAIPNIGEKHYKKFMGFLLTVFFFVWFLNMLGISPLAANVTGSVAVTFALALIVLIITLAKGGKTYWLHIFDPLGNTMPWIAKIPLYILLIPIEILGIFIKPFSLMIRLYANITAGHYVMMGLLGIIFIERSIGMSSFSFVLAFVIFIIEFFVALLQAYIFTMLASLYFGFAVQEHHHDHEEAH
ncbi:F0F1 ATP synthase subunit A [Moheibacter sediminis]|uniref:ATP synthase subunit a n=1 Tax=Moheibacter sediminis TaxID=1434700 RepID=A0A1W2BDT3_9FLAO|nr:F0F1 ATP synthase subunit A [Moheibacter sediminis]SMC71066.1 ATP synthase F0 subcomplex A subunit [Moheibacter sediminis]